MSSPTKESGDNESQVKKLSAVGFIGAGMMATAIMVGQSVADVDAPLFQMARYGVRLSCR